MVNPGTRLVTDDGVVFRVVRPGLHMHARKLAARVLGAVGLRLPPWCQWGRIIVGGEAVWIVRDVRARVWWAPGGSNDGVA